MMRHRLACNIISNTAVNLFTDAGTARVSTNHIAAAASISAANLYFHCTGSGATSSSRGISAAGLRALLCQRSSFLP
jgi:hypothetical protein